MQDQPADQRSTRLLLALTAFAVLGVVACGEGRPREFRPVASVERPATEHETRRILLEGPRALLAGLPDAGGEHFTPDFHYRRNGIASIDGRYDVWGNRVCVSLSWEGPLDHCRTVMIGPDGPRFDYPRPPSPAP